MHRDKRLFVLPGFTVYRNETAVRRLQAGDTPQ